MNLNIDVDNYLSINQLLVLKKRDLCNISLYTCIKISLFNTFGYEFKIKFSFKPNYVTHI